MRVHFGSQVAQRMLQPLTSHHAITTRDTRRWFWIEMEQAGTGAMVGNLRGEGKSDAFLKKCERGTRGEGSGGRRCEDVLILTMDDRRLIPSI